MDHEYRVVEKFTNCPDTTSKTTTNPAEAGNEFRRRKKIAISSEEVKLQKREVGPWTDVESYSKP